ncbi:MAG: phosphate ABC transporter substrate-binding protein [Nitrospirae bacterium]|nr:phosphate ABC transporter substrate-binding protein [Nitrospirota bacterium]
MHRIEKRTRKGLKGWGLGAALGFFSLLMGTSGAIAELGGPTGQPLLDPALAVYAPTAPVSGTMRLAGSDTMQPLINRLASEFRRRHPDVQVTISGGGSAIILQEFLGTEKSKVERVTTGGLIVTMKKSETAGSVLLAASSRPLSDQEVEQFVVRYGYEPLAFPVAMDAVGIYVHRNNPMPSLTLDQVDAIFSTTRQRGAPEAINRWGQLGLSNGWENAQIRLYGRNQKSGTQGFFKDHVLLSGDFVPSIQEEPGAASVILALGRDPFGIGYSGIGLQASTVRLVPLAEKSGMPAVAPSLPSVMDGSYPLRRFLYFFISKAPQTPFSPVAREFLAFANSRDGQEAVIRAGFYPLPLKQAEQNLAILTSTGTR